MTGTVILNSYDTAKTLYSIGINFIENKNIIEGTSYTIDISGKSITLPYQGVLVNLE